MYKKKCIHKLIFRKEIKKIKKVNHTESQKTVIPPPPNSPQKLKSVRLQELLNSSYLENYPRYQLGIFNTSQSLNIL